MPSPAVSQDESPVDSSSASSSSTSSHPTENDLKKNRKQPIRVTTKRSSVLSPSRPILPIDVHSSATSSRTKTTSPSMWSVSTLTQPSVDELPTSLNNVVLGFPPTSPMDKEKKTAQANFIQKNKHRNVLFKILSTREGRRKVCFYTLFGAALGSLVVLLVFYLNYKEAVIFFCEALSAKR